MFVGIIYTIKNSKHDTGDSIYRDDMFFNIQRSICVNHLLLHNYNPLKDFLVFAFP